MPRCRGGGSSTDQWLYRLTCVVWTELSQRESELTITGSMQTALEVQQQGFFLLGSGDGVATGFLPA